MHSTVFLKGIAVGLIVAPPVGPVAMVCIQRTLDRGRIHGIVSGLGAAVADGLLAFVVAFGLAFVSNVLVEEQFWFRLLGGVLLCFLGARVVFSRKAQQSTPAVGTDHLADFASTFLLTLANPVTILAMAAIFASFGLVRADGSYASASLLVVGVFTGSGLSWLTLCTVAHKVLGVFGRGKSAWVNRIAGVSIIAFGLFILLRLIV